MSRSMNRAERLREMERLYIDRAYSDAEMAERLGVDRTTVFRDRIELERNYPLDPVGESRYRINRSKYLSQIKVNLNEALALYLAARRVSRQTRIAQPHVANALEKLAAALRQPMTERLTRAAGQVLEQSTQPERVKILEQVTQGWAERRKVKIAYRALSARKPANYLIAPYLIEPSLWSDGVYVIGRNDVYEDVRTYKIERIETAELTREEFEIPAGFDEQDLLEYAWGIWYEDREPEEIRLRFFPGDAARRLRESIWHRTQQIEELPDGGCIWSARVAEWQEMVPWVRGWGSALEVLAPDGLREEIVREAERLANLYKIKVSLEIPLYQKLWAKTDKEKIKPHPLICHMIDVAMTAQTLWDESLPDGIRSRMAVAIGKDILSAGRIFSFWAGLHDLGKASQCFQQKYPPAVSELKAEGLDFLNLTLPCLHGHISNKTLRPLLVEETCLPDEWARRVALAVGGHHGEWPTKLQAYSSPPQTGGKKWDAVRRQLFLRLKEIIDPPRISPPELSEVERNAFFTLLSGFVSVADWLGSMEEYFQPNPGYVDLEAYASKAQGISHQALQENGWTGWNPPQAPIALVDLCHVASPRPLQQAVINLAEQLSVPGLVLIEAPTGEGKTEAALYLADHWAYTLKQRGAYIAMPTMATSNKMYQRVAKVLRDRYSGESFVGYHLLHGNAVLEENEGVPKFTKIFADQQNANGNVGAASWFTKQKRGLLAPFAVGTVDQSLLSILQTPHFFVRLFGLSHKTIIFDEVHAYDSYMDTLFFHLLKWLRAVDASVVILSATLPEITRRNIIEAYTGLSLPELPAAEYPAITWTDGAAPQTISFPAATPRSLWLERINRDPEIIAKRLELELASGGFAAVLCNTVDRAQKVFKVIREHELVPEEDLHLFHARFPLESRNKIENLVGDRFDNRLPIDSPRRKSIVVATQVIEQSLDLDFDLMITDFAPVDLLLQRAGRLHRNPNRNNRPEPLRKPRLLMAMPSEDNGIPCFDEADAQIYDRYFLLRSYQALLGCQKIEIPGDTRPLLEAVYGSEDHMPGLISHEFQQTISTAFDTMEEKQAEAEHQAHTKLVRPPDDRNLLFSPITGLDEENPELHTYLRAATRLSPPGVTLICLHRLHNGLALGSHPDSQKIDLETPPDLLTTRALFSRKIEVTKWLLVEHFTKIAAPEGWQKSPWLRHARCVEFTNDIYKPDGETWFLKLDPKLGLVFNKGE